MTETTAIITRPTAQDYARANRAPNTLRAYRAAWRACRLVRRAQARRTAR